MELDRVMLGQGISNKGIQSLYINGTEIKYVIDFEVRQEANEMPRVTVTFLATIETLPDVSA